MCSGGNYKKARDLPSLFRSPGTYAQFILDPFSHVKMSWREISCFQVSRETAHFAFWLAFLGNCSISNSADFSIALNLKPPYKHSQLFGKINIVSKNVLHGITHISKYSYSQVIFWFKQTHNTSKKVYKITYFKILSHRKATFTLLWTTIFKRSIHQGIS